MVVAWRQDHIYCFSFVCLFIYIYIFFILVFIFFFIFFPSRVQIKQLKSSELYNFDNQSRSMKMMALICTNKRYCKNRKYKVLVLVNTLALIVCVFIVKSTTACLLFSIKYSTSFPWILCITFRLGFIQMICSGLHHFLHSYISYYYTWIWIRLCFRSWTYLLFFCLFVYIHLH